MAVNFYTAGNLLYDKFYNILGKYGGRVFYLEVTLSQVDFLRQEKPAVLEMAALVYGQVGNNFHLYSAHEYVIVHLLDTLTNNRKDSDHE